MESQRFRCCHCKKLKRRRVAGQRYCSDEECQKARKNAWRRQKYATDPDYRLNQRESTEAWLEANGGTATYHRRYRRERKKRRVQDDGQSSALQPCSTSDGEENPQEITSMSTEGHLVQTVSVNSTTENSDKRETESGSANSDGSSSEIRMKSGRFKLVPLGDANSDALLVEIEVISKG